MRLGEFQLITDAVQMINSIFTNYDRVLMKENSTLIAVHEGKYYKRGDGLAVGPGCFSRGLEYSSGKKAIVIGKPNPYFFKCAVPDGLTPEQCCMIGDVSLFRWETTCYMSCMRND